MKKRNLHISPYTQEKPGSPLLHHMHDPSEISGAEIKKIFLSLLLN